MLDVMICTKEDDTAVDVFVIPSTSPLIISPIFDHNKVLQINSSSTRTREKNILQNLLTVENGKKLLALDGPVLPVVLERA
ncbi:hypothetical protein FEM48_Zijuj12G0119700 [Ziziphus jujuba var. spinosa]|uniref:Uncharacterized protein n=1 Tax=Ziziphus jujuba var. spinosa TaxID=714518 RepID=A0A978UD69_ZIZJJ|nr:hypothetical protein FEM48_Zijuj12G0119700 [Ziziphus jujuba var. spinosa]